MSIKKILGIIGIAVIVIVIIALGLLIHSCQRHTDSLYGVKVASDGTGDAIAIYEDKLGGNIYAQKISPDGRPLWREKGVLLGGGNGKAYSFLNFNIISDGSGGALVVWQQMYSGKIEGGSPEAQMMDIFVQKVNADSNMLWQDGGAQFVEFLKWGRSLRLEIACHPAASDATVAALNTLLASWRFDTVPVGDIQWAVMQARQFLPEAVEPLKFGHQPSIRNDEGVQRITEAENEDNTINVRFTYKWDNSSHWWEMQVFPSGDIILTCEGGEPSPLISLRR